MWGIMRKALTATQPTVASFAASVAPHLAFPNDWLAWPPDTFALTSMLLRQTGCYRLVLDPSWRRPVTWHADLEQCAADWIEYTDRLIRDCCKPSTRRLAFPEAHEPLAEALPDIRALAAEVTLDDLRSLGSPKANRLARALVTLHAVADEACTGFGLLGGIEEEGALTAFLANLLLTAYGSLATIGKHFGVVLPKMRTPQSGLTLRSLSHQVTFHTSEVEVMWRTFPWASVQENSMNLLLVPWPTQVEERRFSAMRETFSAVRYFQYSPDQNGNGSERLPVLVEHIVRVNREVGRLHMVVLPELALNYREYTEFLNMLRLARSRKENRIQHVPMVIAGVQRDDADVATNQVHLAAFFAGRWYELAQRKHHRWKLDRNQIRQYQLESRFATARSWYEHIPLSQRRLSFLAPTPWLTLCPLICEDLAQLEPVAELIRGVGPTMLAALLMDGPQLRDRWSARYASVFADDPGTAVLTLTSLGMVKRSRRVDASTAQVAASDPTIGLWKDQPSGWRSLEMPNGHDTILLSVSSAWGQEFTADGRSDHSVASVFRFEGQRHLSMEPPPHRAPRSQRTGREAPSRPRLGPDAGREYFGDWGDLREVSAAAFTVDALLRLQGAFAPKLHDWLLGKLSRIERTTSTRMTSILALISTALRYPRKVGVEADSSTPWPSMELRRWAAEMRDWLPEMSNVSSTVHIDRWDALTKEACRRLRRLHLQHATGERAMRNRSSKAIALVVLYAIHARLESRRRLALLDLQLPPQGTAERRSIPSDVHDKSANVIELIEKTLERYA